MGPVSRALERKLFDGLKKLFQKLIDDIGNGFVGKNEISSRIREFVMSDEVTNYLQRLIGKMTRSVRVESAKSWREAATRGSNGPLLNRLITHEMEGPVGAAVYEIIANNVAYIKTVPQEWAEYIVQYTARQMLKGIRPEEIETELRKIMPEHITKNLKCIARTECAKANAAIIEARAQMCGIQCYFWRSVKDERSRPSHAKMDKILCFYNDPPNPEKLFPYKASKNRMVKPYGNYHAGNTFNCRCYQEPLVDIRFLPDTFRYHMNGKIYTTTRAAFIKKFGNVAA